VAAAVEDFFAAIARGDLAAVESAARADPALASSGNRAGVSAGLWACYMHQGGVLSPRLW